MDFLTLILGIMFGASSIGQTTINSTFDAPAYPSISKLQDCTPPEWYTNATNLGLKPAIAMCPSSKPGVMPLYVDPPIPLGCVRVRYDKTENLCIRAGGDEISMPK